MNSTFQYISVYFNFKLKILIFLDFAKPSKKRWVSELDKWMCIISRFIYSIRSNVWECLFLFISEHFVSMWLMYMKILWKLFKESHIKAKASNNLARCCHILFDSWFSSLLMWYFYRFSVLWYEKWCATECLISRDGRSMYDK